MKKIIVVREPKEWNLGVKGLEVISQGLPHRSEASPGCATCASSTWPAATAYQSRGYYVSLLAEARGQKVIPSAKTILDLKSPSIVKVLSRDLDEVIQQSLGAQEQARVHLQHVLRRNVNRKYDKLAHELYKVFQSPLLRARFVKGEKWELRSVRPIPYNDIPEEHLPLREALRHGVLRQEALRWGAGRPQPYDLAILVNPDDKAAPSEPAGHREIPAGRGGHGFRVEIIGPGDIDRIGEYDALADPREHPRERPHLPHGAEGPERRAGGDRCARMPS
jgi:hypothetical protein